MRELRNTKIIAVDHGYGNMKLSGNKGTGRTFCETDCRSSGTQPETVIADFSVRTDCRHVGKGIPHQGALSSF